MARLKRIPNCRFTPKQRHDYADHFRRDDSPTPKPVDSYEWIRLYRNAYGAVGHGEITHPEDRNGRKREY